MTFRASMRTKSNATQSKEQHAIIFGTYQLSGISVKATVLIVISMFAAACLLLAQGNTQPPGGNGWRRYQSPYDPKARPPVEMPEAYALALARVGVSTNRFYCVTAGCLESTKRGLPGWTFCFSNTNGQRACVEVSFDREVDADSRSSELLKW
jgi:hypothetical protein